MNVVTGRSRTNRTLTTQTGLLGVASWAMVWVAGCASPFDESPRALVAEDFIGRDGSVASAGVGQRGATAGLPANQSGSSDHDTEMTRVWKPVAGLSRGQGFSPDLGPRGAMELSVHTGPPVLAQSQPQDTAAAQRPAGRLVDAKIGDVHGVPIYVSEFFDDAFLARIRAEAPSVADRPKWRGWVREQTQRKLRGQIVDILLRERARSQLTSRQRQGLLGMLERYQSDLQSNALGTRAAADRRLRELTGQSLEEAVRDRENRVLIELELHDVFRRAVVPSAEIQRWYDRLDRESNLFTPNPVIQLRLVRVPKSNQQSIDAVRTQLDDGTSFLDIAASEFNEFRRDDGGLWRADITGPLSEASPFQSSLEPVNELVRQVSPGQWRGPAETEAHLNWVYLDRIEDNTMSLYDAQYYLTNRLRQDRFIEDRDRHIERLKSDVNFVEEEAMIDRLVIAVETMFFPPI